MIQGVEGKAPVDGQIWTLDISLTSETVWMEDVVKRRLRAVSHCLY
jgi:hypothetical protein